jgi:methionine--tRNA ligase beta chain
MSEDILAGQRLRVGKPLFIKIELETEGQDPTSRFDIRVARIVDVKDHPNADKLYILEVDLGDEHRQIVAGIRRDYAKEELRGRKVALLANLEPAKLRGAESRGMVLAGEDEKDVGLAIPPESAVVGTQIFGTKGAPVLPFSEFQKYKLQVGEGGTVLFLGLGGGSTVILAANGEPLRVDKGLKAGTWVH